MPYVQILLFVVGLVLLLKGADWVTKYAAKIAHEWGISEFMIGITLVSVATSLPELSIALLSGVSGNSDIATGTIIGSNIANIGLVLGIVLLLRPLNVEPDHNHQKYFLLILTLLLSAFLMGGMLWTEGVILMGAALAFIIYSYRRTSPNLLTSIRIFYVKIRTSRTLLDLVLSISGGILVVIGASFIVDSVTRLSAIFLVPEFLIALLVVAVGTSLPEIAASVTAVLKGHKGMSIGNIIGSNMFNISILGFASLMAPISVARSLFTIDIPIMILFTLLLIFFLKIRAQMSKPEGFMFLGLYFLFVYLHFI